MMNAKLTTIPVAILLFSALTFGQDEERIQKLYNDAIQALGGDAYLGVTDVATEGNVFFFSREGSSGLIKYNDYSKLPDRGRNEIGNRKKGRDIVVFNLAKNEGWIQEGQKETRAATPDEMIEFKNSLKHSLGYILRYRFKDPHNKLFYMGPGEGADVQFDLVKVLDEENDEVTVYFDRMNRLPAKIEYRTIGKNEVRLRIVEEFSQWHVTQGINTPLRSDTSRNGVKYRQRYIVKITYNGGIPDSMFEKPEPQK